MNETATSLRMRDMERVNLRRRRAEALVAAVLNKVGHLVDEDVRRDFHYKLFDLFNELGVDVLTDLDRREFGLPPRDDHGWTAAEVQALELKRLEVMMRPIVVPLAPGKVFG